MLRVAELIHLASAEAETWSDTGPLPIFLLTHRFLPSHVSTVKVAPALLCRIEECGLTSLLARDCRLQTDFPLVALAVLLAGVYQFALVLRVAHLLARAVVQTLFGVNTTSSLPNFFANLPNLLSFLTIFVCYTLVQYKA